MQIPDDSDFCSFREQCLSTEGWTSRYSKGGVTVWGREEDSSTVQKLKVSRVTADAFTAKRPRSFTIKAILKVTEYIYSITSSQSYSGNIMVKVSSENCTG